MAHTSSADTMKVLHVAGEVLRHPLTVALNPGELYTHLLDKIAPALREGLLKCDVYITNAAGSRMWIQNMSDNQQLLVHKKSAKESRVESSCGSALTRDNVANCCRLKELPRVEQETSAEFVSAVRRRNRVQRRRRKRMRKWRLLLRGFIR